MSGIISAIMTKKEFDTCLNELKLTQLEAARLLSVNARTLRRWAANPAEMPGPAEQALRAWLRLHRYSLPWRPEGITLPGNTPAEVTEQLARYREHNNDLANLLQAVEARGGPAAPWQVDLKRNQATLGPMRLTFYRLPNGGFSPQIYNRSDIHPDEERDKTLIEDGWACVAKAIADERKRKSK